MAAHLAGACAGHASWAEFKRQNIQNPYLPEAEMKIDGINQRQVEDRAEATPNDLIAELREVGPKAIRTRQRLPGLLRAIPVPFGPPLGTVPIGYMTDLIYVRDMWMHRVDICQATGREMALTPDHDGRIIALVMRDLGKRLQAFIRNNTNYLEIKRKSGSSRIDLNQWLEKVQLCDETTFEVTIKMSGGKTVGPYEVLRALLKLKAVEKEKVLVIKTGEQFRIGPFSDSSTTEPCIVS